MFFKAQLESEVKKQLKESNIKPQAILKKSVPEDLSSVNNDYLQRREISESERSEVIEKKHRLRLSTVYAYVQKYAPLGMCVVILNDNECGSPDKCLAKWLCRCCRDEDVPRSKACWFDVCSKFFTHILVSAG